MTETAVKLTIVHTVRHTPQGSYVREQIDGWPTSVEYGPMPPDAVGPLMDERKEWLEDATEAFLQRASPLSEGAER